MRARLAVKFDDVIIEAPPVMKSCFAEINVLAVENIIGALVFEKVAPLLKRLEN